MTPLNMHGPDDNASTSAAAVMAGRPPLTSLTHLHGWGNAGAVYTDCARCQANVSAIQAEANLYRNLANERAQEIAALRSRLADSDEHRGARAVQ